MATHAEICSLIPTQSVSQRPIEASPTMSCTNSRQTRPGFINKRRGFWDEKWSGREVRGKKPEARC